MIKWIREWFAQRNFTKAWREAAEEKYDRGEISTQEYLSCIRAADNPTVMAQARNQLKSDPNMLGGISDWDWEAIYNWFVEFFIPAMRIIIPLVITLMDEDDSPA